MRAALLTLLAYVSRVGVAHAYADDPNRRRRSTLSSTSRQASLSSTRRPTGHPRLVDSAEDLKLAHRLDDGTSGCLVLAKGRRAAAAIGDAFAAKRVAKVYVGLTASRPSKKKGVIVGDMIRSRRAQWRLTRDCGPTAACTWLSRSIGLGPGEGDDPAARLIVARPLTGKTHQIRVAAKSIGAPLLGDGLYGGGNADRLYLHAAAICIPDLGLDARASPDSGASFLSRRFADAWSAVDLEAELADDALPRAAREFLAR